MAALPTTDADDVRGVASTGALRVVGVDGASLEGLDRLLAARRLVQRVRVDHHLPYTCDNTRTPL